MEREGHWTIYNNFHDHLMECNVRYGVCLDFEL